MELVSAICPNCGANLKVDDNLKRITCNYCHSEIIVDDAIEKYQIEVTGKVSVDNSDKLSKLYILARRAMDEGNDEDAFKYYSMISEENPNDWEAYFYTKYFKCMTSLYNENFLGDMSTLSRSMINVFDLVEQEKDFDRKKDIVIQIFNKISQYEEFSHTALSNYIREEKAKVYTSTTNQLPPQFMEKIRENEANMQYYLSMSAILKNTGEELLKYDKACALEAYKKIDLDRLMIDEEKQKIISRIKELDPSYNYVEKQNQQKNGGCYVATCVYGSYNCPEVWSLRRYRDYYLAKKWYGRLFVKIYYAVSPKLVEVFGKQVWFRKLWRTKLDKKVLKLKKAGYESTPYIDAKW